MGDSGPPCLTPADNSNTSSGVSANAVVVFEYPNKKVPDKKRITSKETDTNRSETEKKTDPAICVFQNLRFFSVFCPYFEKNKNGLRFEKTE